MRRLVKWQQVAPAGDKLLRYNLFPTLDVYVRPHTHPAFAHETICTQGKIKVRLENRAREGVEHVLVPGDPAVHVPAEAFHSIYPLEPDSIACCICPRFDAAGRELTPRELANAGAEVL